MELKSVEDTSWLQLFIKNTALCKHESGRIRCDACPILHLSILQSPVFLLNSRLGHFSAPPVSRGAPSPEVTGLICLVP